MWRRPGRSWPNWRKYGGSARQSDCNEHGEVIEIAMRILEAIPLIGILLGTAVAVRAQTISLPIDGARIYGQYCASCHGVKATGDGPTAAVLKAVVPDLTSIAKRNGGVFPLDRVQATIAGEKPAGLSHGSREMPLWGPIFSSDLSDRDYGKLRLFNVAKYLESLQRK